MGVDNNATLNDARNTRVRFYQLLVLVLVVLVGNFSAFKRFDGMKLGQQLFLELETNMIGDQKNEQNDTASTRTCSNIAIAIKSAPQQKYRARRDAWRKSDCPRSYRDANMTYKFMLGIPAIDTIHPLSHNQGKRMNQQELEDLASVKNESLTEGDIHILPILDLYDYLYLKSFMILEYLSTNSKGFVVVVHDDEYCVNTTVLQNVCHQAWNASQTILGGTYFWRSSGYDIQKGFDGSFYPYFGGALTVLSWDLVRKIVEMRGYAFAGLEGPLADDVDIGRWANKTGLPLTFVERSDLMRTVPVPNSQTQL